jgi:hypothetical protein
MERKLKYLENMSQCQSVTMNPAQTIWESNLCPFGAIITLLIGAKWTTVLVVTVAQIHLLHTYKTSNNIIKRVYVQSIANYT